MLFNLLLLASLAFAQVSRDQVLFGVEYTFQDQTMVDEPGRNTIETPYKWGKAEQFAHQLASAVGLSKSAVSYKASWKQGYYLTVPGDGKWVINPEPVTIEVNTTPRKVNELVETSTPIFQVAEKIGLVPYVQPAAERSGMGHIHVGARSMAENPFFVYPQLLRNVMVYLHKNPALLHGFAEAFDIGMNSNIETYHDEKRQKVFEQVVAEFDSWFEGATKNERARGLSHFLSLLAKHDQGIGFFQHYRYINLEHLRKGASEDFKPTDSGKLTVEFRNFRPPLDSATTFAFANLLLSVMDLQSRENHLEPFVWVSQKDYLLFNSASKVLENWRKVKRELKIQIPQLDQQIHEYVTALDKSFQPLSRKGLSVSLAYSQKSRKGEFYELKLSKDLYSQMPEITLGGKPVDLASVKVGEARYWHAVIDINDYDLKKSDMKSGSFFKLTKISNKSATRVCRRAVGH